MTRRLKILEVNKFYAPHIGGIETLIRQRAEYFAQRPDVEVKVLVCREGRGKAEVRQIGGVDVYYCSSLGTYFSCPLSLEFFRKFKEMAQWADVVEIHTPFPLGDAACLLSKCKCRVVIAWHSDVIKQKFLLQFYKPVLKRFLKRADTIITATKGHIDGSDFLPEFAEKCRIIPYPLDASLYGKPGKHILQCRNAGAGKVLFVGRLVYYKGVSYLIEAFRNVRGCELFLCGTGRLESELKAQAAGLPVHFLGQLSDEDLKAAFADCDIFVLPSVERSEAFGIVQQEAMACGKPVINTSLRSGVPYVSVHGETGLTVPPKDAKALAKAIQKLADDAALRETYGRRAAEKVRRDYAPDSIMEQILDVLREGL